MPSFNLSSLNTRCSISLSDSLDISHLHVGKKRMVKLGCVHPALIFCSAGLPCRGAYMFGRRLDLVKGGVAGRAFPVPATSDIIGKSTRVSDRELRSEFSGYRHRSIKLTSPFLPVPCSRCPCSAAPGSQPAGFLRARRQSCYPQPVWTRQIQKVEPAGADPNHARRRDIELRPSSVVR